MLADFYNFSQKLQYLKKFATIRIFTA